MYRIRKLSCVMWRRTNWSPRWSRYCTNHLWNSWSGDGWHKIDGTGNCILWQHLNMKRLSVRWVSRLLLINQKWDGVTCSKYDLQPFQLTHRTFVDVPSSWITQGKFLSSDNGTVSDTVGRKSALIIVEIVPSTRKVLAVIATFFEVLKESWSHYALLLEQLNADLQEKC